MMPSMFDLAALFDRPRTPPGAVPRDLAEARKHLLPVLLPLAGLDVMRIGHLGLDNPSPPLEEMFPFRPLAADLGLGLAFDDGASFAVASPAHLEAWGVTLDEGLAVAEARLHHLHAPHFAQATPGLFVSRFGDAARLVAPELAQQVVGDSEPVAMVPDGEYLLLASSRDDAAIESMLAMAAELLQAPRRLSATPFRLDGGQWRAWQPSHEPVAATLHNLQRKKLADDYEEQSQALRDALERSAQDVFVADHGLLRTEAAPRMLSLSTLAHEVHAWLPLADVVAVQPPGGEVQDTLLVPWAAFRTIAGELLQPLSCVPPRFDYRGGLGEPHFERLRAATVTLAEAARGL